ncbi:MFS transporter [Mobilicoccus pelagius]|uniref:Putative major facilitator superfamily transporter n=1 Tax=Mobilicoccus pelagius NBRC 104925 TaxID=1089455 RepID=H5UP19_9MICO|nr:MFS transporter [Mobilicoccus pelagius]GAB47477.1 putative major facilitator superfamily transporter [Mobilicoccus pelagius NBRC 104925]
MSRPAVRRPVRRAPSAVGGPVPAPTGRPGGHGIAAGGELSNTSASLSEVTPPGPRGRYVSFMYIGIGIAFIVATGLGHRLAEILGPEQMAESGWRIPFVLGGILALVGLFMRKGLQGSELFEEHAAKMREKAENPLLTTLREYPMSVLHVLGTAMLSTIVHYTFIGAINSQAAKTYGAKSDDVFMASTLSMVLFIELQCRSVRRRPDRPHADVPHHRHDAEDAGQGPRLVAHRSGRAQHDHGTGTARPRHGHGTTTARARHDHGTGTARPRHLRVSCPSGVRAAARCRGDDRVGARRPGRYPAVVPPIPRRNRDRLAHVDPVPANPSGGPGRRRAARAQAARPRRVRAACRARRLQLAAARAAGAAQGRGHRP